LSVADNARYAVLLHVSASSEREERKKKLGAMTKTKERHILTHIDVCGPFVFCFYTAEHLIMQVS